MPSAPHNSAENLAFYQGHLDRVSRSFAFCIRELQAPLREWTSLAYLLCRILDTVEDSLWPCPKLHMQQYTAFEQFMTHRPARACVTTWAQAFPVSVAPGEQTLLDEAHRLFAQLHDLPLLVQQTTRQTVLHMSAGMRHYTSRRPRAAGGALRLTDAVDVNRYCYFVAGLVGYLLTHLYKLAHTLVPMPETAWRDAFHFGLFLQKVNLLKDQRSDEAAGRFLVPDRHALIGSLRQHAEGALAYVKVLPRQERAYRTFCGWSLFLGAASLPAIETAFAGGGQPKLPRAQTQALLHKVATLVQDDVAMEQAFRTYLVALPTYQVAPKQSSVSLSSADWFTPLAGDFLSTQDCIALDLIADPIVGDASELTPRQ